MRISDWSSDVCSSDLTIGTIALVVALHVGGDSERTQHRRADTGFIEFVPQIQHQADDAGLRRCVRGVIGKPERQQYYPRRGGEDVALARCPHVGAKIERKRGAKGKSETAHGSVVCLGKIKQTKNNI